MSHQILIETAKSQLNVDDFGDLELLETLEQETKPLLKSRPEIIVYGRVCHQNRNVGFFSDDSIGYNYSRQLMESQPLTENLKKLIDFVNEKYSSNFNGVLINEYLNGCDSIGAHSDDETGLAGKNGVVAISCGATRKFRIRDKKNRKIVKDIPMTHGQILQMKGDFQKVFTHEIPVEKRVTEPRVSFTFRYHRV